MGYVKLGVSLYSAGQALEAQRLVKRLLDEHLPAEFQPFDSDVEVEIDEHSGACSVEDCGRDHHPSGGPETTTRPDGSKITRVDLSSSL